MKHLGFLGAAMCALAFASTSHAAPTEGHEPIEYRALKIEDFPIRQHVAPNLDAFTWVRMTYHLQQKSTQEGAMWRSEVVLMDIHCMMSPDKSWRRATVKDEKAVLVHEQGHFDMCESKARKLRQQTLSAYPVGRGSDRVAAETDLTHAVEGYFKKRYDELNKDANKYDKDTKHGRQAAKQKAWTERLTKGVSE